MHGSNAYYASAEPTARKWISRSSSLHHSQSLGEILPVATKTAAGGMVHPPPLYLAFGSNYRDRPRRLAAKPIRPKTDSRHDAGSGIDVNLISLNCEFTSSPMLARLGRDCVYNEMV